MSPARLLLDVRPLRESPHFRRLWVGTALSALGSQMTAFAVALQVYTLTRSSLAVGGVGLAMALPAVLFGLLGGSIADAFDRRSLVLLCSGLAAVVSGAFAVQAFAGLDRVWPLYCLVVAQSLISSVNAPARRTFLPRLLRADQLPAGTALTLLAWHASTVVGPALAGVVAATWGLLACYLVDVLSFAAALHGIVRLPPMPPEGGAVRPGPRAVGEALRLVRRTPVLAGAFLADTSAMLLGMPVALFPALNAERFGGSEQTLGLLTAAPAVGGVIAAALSGPVGRVSRQGRAMLVAGALWGVGVAGFGLAHDLALALLLLAVAGAADAVSVVFRTTLVQLATPDRHRGRIAAAEHVVGAGFPQLGNFRAGAVASLTSPGLSAVSGGVATVVAAGLIGLALPGLVRHRAR
ncbi:MFS transporter [Umezawaea beigongshangensis]|uniref:MFS transporter n=1 Tax=Umezawaea beigongshangensis TaxID=2780383 RepID=UPI0018F1FC83|nr:MFS transporter [Umezawaea beigongshangensis]